MQKLITMAVTNATTVAAARPTDEFVNADLIFVLDVVITGFLCIFGFVGNILCLITLCMERRKNSNIYLLSALAVFDWFMLLFMLNGVVLPGLCKHFEACDGYLAFMRSIVHIVWATGCIVQTATIWMVVAVTLDRFIAVCLPLQTRKTSSAKRAKQLIIGVVVFSIVFNLPRFFHFYPIGGGTNALQTETLDEELITVLPADATGGELDILYANKYVSNDDGNNDTSVSSPKQGVNLSDTHHWNTSINNSDDYIYIPVTLFPRTDRASNVGQGSASPILLSHNQWYHFIYYITLSWLVQYVIPIISLLVLNIILLRQIRHAQRKRAKLRNKQVINMQNENISVTINIIAIVTVFILCQTPDFVHTLISYSALGVNRALLRYLRCVCYCFLALNSSSNFLLYCLFFQRFRKTLLRLFCFNGRIMRKNSRYERQVSDNGDYSSHTLTPTKLLKYDTPL